MEGDFERVRTIAATRAERLSAEQVLSALVLLRRLRSQLAEWEPHLIAAARELGTSWADLAPALGVASRQAAERRYLRLRPGAGDTGEQRVVAQRDLRAGDRAVSAWARENAAQLRTLAGQVGAAGVLSVSHALGDDDPTTLLHPLAAARAQLGASHPDLARQIDEISERTHQIRRDTQARRDSSR
ncbi:hypothetical protein [Fodinicola acaciae]|uniref:hypothetical protein n=1 Tax=Fodinicola acaciae TaxID=2681555 RepID=UPI001C9E4C79|nr:hypothetical protein [Fodinicola acaciae]